MKKTHTSALAGMLLLLLSTHSFAANTIKSIDGCLLKIYNERGNETNVVNLKALDVFRYSSVLPGKTMVTLIYGGTGFIQIGQLPDKKVDELKTAYEQCVK